MIKLENKKIIQYFILLLLLQILNGYIFNYLNKNFFYFESPFFEEIPAKEMFFLVVIIAPIIETLIFQYLLFSLLNQIRIKNTLIIVLLMSFAFSLAHWYHWLYVVATFINGFFLNYFYVYIYKYRNELVAVLLTIALHASYNLYGFLFVQ